MKVLQLTMTVNALGHLLLDIPTNLAAGQVNIVLVVKPVVASNVQKPHYDFSDLVERLTWRGDAVAIQRSLRDEW